MARYFFDHAENGRFITDKAGTELPDEASAFDVACARIRRQVRRCIRDGGLPVGGYVSVRRACGERLMFVPYKEGMTR